MDKLVNIQLVAVNTSSPTSGSQGGASALPAANTAGQSSDSFHNILNKQVNNGEKPGDQGSGGTVASPGLPAEHALKSLETGQNDANQLPVEILDQRLGGEYLIPELRVDPGNSQSLPVTDLASLVTEGERQPSVDGGIGLLLSPEQIIGTGDTEGELNAPDISLINSTGEEEQTSLPVDQVEHAALPALAVLPIQPLSTTANTQSETPISDALSGLTKLVTPSAETGNGNTSKQGSASGERSLVVQGLAEALIDVDKDPYDPTIKDIISTKDTQANEASVLDKVNAAITSQPASATSASGQSHVQSLSALPQFNRIEGQQNSALLPQLTIDRPLNQPDWNQSVGNKIMWMISRDVNVAELRLNPPQLGPIEVRVSIEKDNASVTFVAQHGVVKESLESAIPRLREMLGENGLNLVDVDVSQQSFTEQRQQFSDGYNNDQHAYGQSDHDNEVMDNASLLNLKTYQTQGVLDVYA